ncbi:MAG: PfkB family carbohydrate kinase [Candidatus Promineifilaceae bacterium]|nr:PfkB family carbohydrate kinase [Candidatus Promineifilaceae bacterium]
MSRFDYLVIGHLTRDVTPAGDVVGGTVAYAGHTAHVLGSRTAVVTSAGPEIDVESALAEMTVHCVPAARTTTFENRYDEGKREQRLYHLAAPLKAEHVPAGWRRTPIVHLGPVAGEVDEKMVHHFSNSLVGLTPQGWLRGWDEQGTVFARRWDRARELLPLAAAVVLSDEDLPDEAALQEYRRWARLLALTHGADGCTIYLGDESRHFPAPAVSEQSLTGAGDVFAAAFFIRLYQTKGNPWEAATFANEMAAQSVTQPDLRSKVRHLETLRE